MTEESSQLWRRRLDRIKTVDLSGNKCKLLWISSIFGRLLHAGQQLQLKTAVKYVWAHPSSGRQRNFVRTNTDGSRRRGSRFVAAWAETTHSTSYLTSLCVSFAKKCAEEVWYRDTSEWRIIQLCYGIIRIFSSRSAGLNRKAQIKSLLNHVIYCFDFSSATAFIQFTNQGHPHNSLHQKQFFPHLSHTNTLHAAR